MRDRAHIPRILGSIPRLASKYRAAMWAWWADGASVAHTIFLLVGVGLMIVGLVGFGLALRWAWKSY